MRAAWLMGGSGLFAACSLILPSVDELAGGSERGDASTHTGGAAGSDASGQGGTSAAGSGGQAGAKSCPGSAGPAMVSVGAYCIDSTEVTAEQYAQFLAVAPAPSTSSHAYCAGNNTAYEPSTWPNVSIDQRPVVWVDWCDAWDYCAWAGKRLCAGIGGATVTYDAALDATVHEWFNACTNDGTTPVPYGTSPATGVCNVGGTALATVGSFAACHGQGEFASIFDQVGNAREWVNVCSGADWCEVLGGAFPNSGEVCSDREQQPKLTARDDIGFRCCADPS